AVRLVERVRADGRDVAVADADVADRRRRAGAVEPAAVADHGVEAHGLVLSWGPWGSLGGPRWLPGCGRDTAEVLTIIDNYLTFVDMAVVRGTPLSGYSRLAAELGGDPAELLRAAGIRLQDVGDHEVFLPYRSLIVAVETAATATATPDFGRRL